MENRLTLGVTTIGELLLENKIGDIGDKESRDGVILRIPEYQRPYKWTAKNTNQLLDDIQDALNANREVYRVGTLILHLDEKGNYNIVDGQQRIITFSLLLKRLCLNDVNFDFLNQKLSDNVYSIHNVLNNKRAIDRRFDKLKKKEEIDRWAEYVKNQCELVVVVTDDLSEAFQFFDSQNARGKALYPHDLLKAFHLREMNNLDESRTEKTVQIWENLNQKRLSILFNEYLYRLKEWIKGNRAGELTERNIDLFKGVTSKDLYPYAQYYKGAYAYADELNHSHVPFVAGIQEMRPYQIDAPIIAGEPFFSYTKYYFDILADIQNNDKYEGYFIQDNDIVKTLDLRKYKNGVGNQITRLMFDTAILLYVDRFCPAKPSAADTEFLEQFVVFAFIWAYSMRAQYQNVGWQVAQNYILGNPAKEILNAFNLYQLIVESDSPSALLSRLADRIMPLDNYLIKAKTDDWKARGSYGLETDIPLNYLYYFDLHHYWKGPEAEK